MRTRKIVGSYDLDDRLSSRTSVTVERWFEGGRWHARCVFGEAFGPEVESDDGVGIWFLAAARYFEGTVTSSV